MLFSPRLRRSSMPRHPSNNNRPTKTCAEMGHKNPDRCMCGAGVYRRLPLLVTELRCKCDNPEWSSLFKLGIQKGSATICLTCGLLHCYSLSVNFYVCDGCDNYFTPDFLNWPVGRTSPKPKYLLCKKCDVNVPSAVSRRRQRSGIRFN